jgi:hypothetical protein
MYKTAADIGKKEPQDIWEGNDLIVDTETANYIFATHEDELGWESVDGKI